MEESRRERAPVPTLDPRAQLIIQKVAGEYADKYLSDYVLPHFQRLLKLPDSEIATVREALDHPVSSLLVFFGHYAFARRGKDRDDLSSAALLAIHRLFADRDPAEILKLDDGTELWTIFDKVCEDRGRKSNEAQNRGLLQGILELSQEVYRADGVGSIAAWVVDAAEDTGRIEEEFNRIVDIRGVGPKSTSTFLRDVIQIFGCEDQIDPADRIYFQPVDRWLRAIAQIIVPEPNMDQAADWIVAGKVSKYTRRAGVSGIRFNMGTTHFGQRVVKDPERFEAEIANLVRSANADRQGPFSAR